MKKNRLPLAAFICGLVVLLSLVVYWLLLLLTGGYQLGFDAQFLATLMELTVPLRNLCSTAAIVLGILALREARKSGGTTRDRWFAWFGILLGTGWFLFGVLVGGIFILGEMMY